MEINHRGRTKCGSSKERISLNKNKYRTFTLKMPVCMDELRDSGSTGTFKVAQSYIRARANERRETRKLQLCGCFPNFALLPGCSSS